MFINEEDMPAALAALYNHARPVGMGILHYDPKPMTEKEAADLLKNYQYFDYLKGRPLKMQMTSPLNFRLYDRDNGVGAGEQVVLEVLTNPNRK